MENYVYCAECGTILDSEFAILYTDKDKWQHFFCCERHMDKWVERDRFARMMDS